MPEERGDRDLIRQPQLLFIESRLFRGINFYRRENDCIYLELPCGPSEELSPFSVSSFSSLSFCFTRSWPMSKRSSEALRNFFNVGVSKYWEATFPTGLKVSCWDSSKRLRTVLMKWTPCLFGGSSYSPRRVSNANVPIPGDKKACFLCKGHIIINPGE